MDMKLWRKIIFDLIVVMMLFIATLVMLGYRQYQDAIAKISITDNIHRLESRKDFVPYEKLPSDFIQATLAIEDRRFFKHHGIDYLATSRALLQTIFSDQKSGGSTITQQLAKNLYFDYSPSLIRKVAELFVAHDLERMYTKEQIFSYYVNIINYGDGFMGISAAAYGYFQTSSEELNLDQCTLLAGLPQSPTNYQLSNHKDNALKRQKQVLQAMVDSQMITLKEMNQILSEDSSND